MTDEQERRAKWKTLVDYTREVDERVNVRHEADLETALQDVPPEIRETVRKTFIEWLTGWL